MSALPNLFVVGAAKSGTTAIYHYFLAHPQIYVPGSIKEPNYMAFFAGLPSLNGPGDMKHSAAKSITQLSDYLNLYEARKDEPIAADISPAYLYHPQTAAKIAQLCPQAKIAIVLRNPVEGVLSMFSMMQHDARENCTSLAEAFERADQRMADGWEWAWDYKHCFLYSRQIARYLALFHPSQLFIRRYEQLKQTPEQFYRELMQFLGVDNVELPGANRWVNKSARRADLLRRSRSGKVLLEMIRAARKLLPHSLYHHFKLNSFDQPAFTLSPQDRRMLIEHFRSDISQLSRLLKWNLDDWLQVDNASAPPAFHLSSHARHAAVDCN